MRAVRLAVAGLKRRRAEYAPRCIRFQWALTGLKGLPLSEPLRRGGPVLP